MCGVAEVGQWRTRGGARAPGSIRRLVPSEGQRDKGEDDLSCAVREVEEETGFRGTIHCELPSASYIDHKGRPKVVRYWSLEYSAGDFVANDEVDELRWVSLEQAKSLLGYSHDVLLLGSLDGSTNDP